MVHCPTSQLTRFLAWRVGFFLRFWTAMCLRFHCIFSLAATTFTLSLDCLFIHSARLVRRSQVGELCFSPEPPETFGPVEEIRQDEEDSYGSSWTDSFFFSAVCFFFRSALHGASRACRHRKAAGLVVQ